MDFEKLKKDMKEKGVEKSQEELDKLKSRLGGFNSGEVSTTSTASRDEQTGRQSQATPPGHDLTEAASPVRAGATPVMDSGKADIGEPDTPRDQDKIREPRTEDEVRRANVRRAADEQAEESRREAALEQNPANDVDGEDQAEDAA
ncbi:MAG TPA: hypothetical protein VFY05_10795 [Candidatus Angelobacter sp.]|nr:hypothetical protein [Candidatus Angelobacter sp.]